MKILLALGLISLACSAAVQWNDTPIGASCGQQGQCANCHEGSAPRTHTSEFILTGHGQPAWLNRTQCLACHQESSCSDCHLKEQPQWHSETFCKPVQGSIERDLHALVAANHRRSCVECHSQKFQQQCASCHQPDEASFQ